MRYTIFDADNNIVNIVEWDGISDWSPPEGHTVAQSKDEDTMPAPKAVADEVDILTAALLAKGIITKADIAAATPAANGNGQASPNAATEGPPK